MAACNDVLGLGKKINQSTTADLSVDPSSAFHQKSHVDNILPLEGLENELKFGEIHVYLLRKPIKSASPLLQHGIAWMMTSMVNHCT